MVVGTPAPCLHARQTIIGDWNYFGHEFEHDLTGRELVLLRPARKGEPERAGRSRRPRPDKREEVRMGVEDIQHWINGNYEWVLTTGRYAAAKENPVPTAELPGRGSVGDLLSG